MPTTGSTETKTTGTTSDLSFGGGDDGGGGGGAGDDAGAGSPLGKRKSDDEGAVEKTGDGSGGSSGGRGGDDGTFAGRMQAARSELESAGFELRDFKLT